MSSPELVRVLGFGAGGHAAVMIEAIRAMGGYEIVGLLDADPQKWGSTCLDIAVVGDDTKIKAFCSEGVLHFFNGVGSVRDTKLRQNIYERALQNGLTPINVLHPTAIVSPSATLGDGVAVLSHAFVGSRSTLGHNVLVNTGAIVEHDCTVGSHVHIASGATIGGGVRIDDGVHIGLGARIIQGQSIGRNAIIGAGAVVIRDVLPNQIVVGIPAHPI